MTQRFSAQLKNPSLPLAYRRWDDTDDETGGTAPGTSVRNIVSARLIAGVLLIRLPSHGRYRFVYIRRR